MAPPEAHRRFWHSTVVLVLFLISQGNLARILSPLHPSFMEMQFAFTPARFFQILAEWGAEGVARYRHHFAFDLLHPLIFAALGWVAVQTSPVFGGLEPKRERLFRWLLPVAAGFDYLENSCQLKLLSVQHGTADWLVPVSATCTTVKWSLAAIFTAVFIRQLFAFAGKRSTPPA